MAPLEERRAELRRLELERQRQGDCLTTLRQAFEARAARLAESEQHFGTAAAVAAAVVVLVGGSSVASGRVDMAAFGPFVLAVVLLRPRLHSLVRGLNLLADGLASLDSVCALLAEPEETAFPGTRDPGPIERGWSPSRSSW